MKLVVASLLALALALPAVAAQVPTLDVNPDVVGMVSQVALSGSAGTGKPGQTVFVVAGASSMVTT